MFDLHLVFKHHVRWFNLLKRYSNHIQPSFWWRKVKLAEIHSPDLQKLFKKKTKEGKKRTADVRAT